MSMADNSPRVLKDKAIEEEKETKRDKKGKEKAVMNADAAAVKQMAEDEALRSRIDDPKLEDLHAGGTFDGANVPIPSSEQVAAAKMQTQDSGKHSLLHHIDRIRNAGYNKDGKHGTVSSAASVSDVSDSAGVPSRSMDQISTLDIFSGSPATASPARSFAIDDVVKVVMSHLKLPGNSLNAAIASSVRDQTTPIQEQLHKLALKIDKEENHDSELELRLSRIEHDNESMKSTLLELREQLNELVGKLNPLFDVAAEVVRSNTQIRQANSTLEEQERKIAEGKSILESLSAAIPEQRGSGNKAPAKKTEMPKDAARIKFLKKLMK